MARDVRGSVSVTDVWLISRASDFWVVCAGGASVLLAMAAGLVWYEGGALVTADLLLAELHVGATYDAVVRRRLWRRMPLDVLVVPLAIVAATYALALSGRSVLVATSIVYLAAWHRGRQNLGIARHYQRHAGGPLSEWHRWLFAAAIYLPMAASVAYFTNISPLHEGEEYLAPPLPPDLIWLLGGLAAASLAAYLVWTLGRVGLPGAAGADGPPAEGARPTVHPGERWLVMANAVAFGSAYVLGAWTESFLLVLVLHHEVQYLYFAYAMARRSAGGPPRSVRRDLRLLASFAIWPLVGLAVWAVCVRAELDILTPFLAAGLLAHYWLDGRIWTARARRLSAA